jgi:DNA-binding beta-propeller fold protein YncE
MRGTFILSLLSAVLGASAGLTTSNLETHVDVLALDNAFNPVKESYWTGYPHHRRTPFAVSPDGKSAYIAYLDSSETDVHVQELDPTTFEATGTTVTVTGGKEGKIAYVSDLIEFERLHD